MEERKRSINQILIIEDEVIIGMALAADLEDLGFEVKEVVSSGEEAIQVIENDSVDLVILDLKLGNNMDGIETLRRIRQIADPKVVIISGNSELRMVNLVQEMKIDGFLVKPLNIKDLQNLLNAIYQAQAA